jgi:hypothetical protein
MPSGVFRIGDAKTAAIATHKSCAVDTLGVYCQPKALKQQPASGVRLYMLLGQWGGCVPFSGKCFFQGLAIT